jgi:hypothetical protein
MVAHGLSCLVLGADVCFETGLLLAVPAFSFSSILYIMFALFWSWCQYSHLLYNQQRLSFDHFFTFSIVCCSRPWSFIWSRIYIVANVITVGFGVCRCASYFSCWLLFLHRVMLIASVLEPCLSYCPCRRDLQHRFTKKHVTRWYQFWLNSLLFTRFPVGYPGELCTETGLPLVLHGGAKVTPSFIRKPSPACYWQLWGKRHLNGQAVLIHAHRIGLWAGALHFMATLVLYGVWYWISKLLHWFLPCPLTFLLEGTSVLISVY